MQKIKRKIHNVTDSEDENQNEFLYKSETIKKLQNQSCS